MSPPPGRRGGSRSQGPGPRRGNRNQEGAPGGGNRNQWPAPRAGDGGAVLGGTQVEGRNAVVELLSAGRRAVREVWLSDTAARSASGEHIRALAGDRGVPVRLVPRERLDELARTDAPQGVVAYAAPVAEADLDQLLEPAGPSASPGPPFLLVLDGVTDPGNLGALLRSAACAGVSGVVVGRHRSAPLTPAAVKAAAGAVEHLPFAVVPGIPAALADLSRRGVWSVGLDAQGDEVLWGLQVLEAPVALVLGAEGHGLSPLARKRCEVVARIPMTGVMESLNVSVAGALACFEVARVRSR